MNHSAKEFRVEIRIRNAVMLRAMERAGYDTAAELSRASGVSQSMIGNYLSLKLSPILKDGGFSSAILRISDFIKCLPKDMFPDGYLTRTLARNKVLFDASPEEIGLLALTASQSHIPEYEIRRLRDEVSQNLFSGMDGLTDRSRAVLVMRFGLDGKEPKPYGVIGKSLNLTAPRIRQIEMSALAKLKKANPKIIRARDALRGLEEAFG